MEFGSLYPGYIKFGSTTPPDDRGIVTLVKIAGALSMMFGAMIASLLFLLPTSGSVLGISYTCGAPIITIFASTAQASSLDKALIEDCKQQSYPRVIAGALVGFIGMISGGIMIGVGAQQSSGKYGPAYPSPHPSTLYQPPPWNLISSYDPESPWNQRSPWDQSPPYPGPPHQGPPTS